MYHSYFQSRYSVYMYWLFPWLHIQSILNCQAKDLLGFSSGLLEFRTVISNHHSWPSASSLMPLSLAFRFPTGSPYYGTGLVPASAYFSILVPDWPDADSPAFSKTVWRKKEVHPAPLHCWRWRGIHPSCTFIQGCWWYYTCFMMLINHM